MGLRLGVGSPVTPQQTGSTSENQAELIQSLLPIVVNISTFRGIMEPAGSPMNVGNAAAGQPEEVLDPVSSSIRAAIS